MGLEAVVFPQDLFGHTCNEFYTVGGVEEEKGVVLECEMGGGAGSWDPSCSSMLQGIDDDWDMNASPQVAGTEASAEAGRRKRRRATRCKNKDEAENQRVTHIAVERNRRKQMNEYLAVLQSLMPPSYVQRSDQASIIGGAINYVKKLEQLLQSLVAQKRIKQRLHTAGLPSPFADFFTSPQYSSHSSSCSSSSSSGSNHNNSNTANQLATADVEVTMSESHANLKVLSRRQPEQLLKLVEGLQNLRLTTLHLHVTTVDQIVLYSFNLEVEDDCQCTSADEIATEVYQMLRRTQEEAGVIGTYH